MQEKIRLNELVQEYVAEINYKAGDFITWKPGMRVCTFPEVGAAAIAVELVPGRKEQNGDPAAFTFPRDVRVAVLTPGGELFMFWQDSHRFVKDEL